MKRRACPRRERFPEGPGVGVLLALLLSSQVWPAEGPSDGPLAAIRLYNPTRLEAPALVQVPVGRLATPSLIDWENVQLRRGGESVPFALREGKAVWRAALRNPVQEPRAEDLLVFQISVPALQWAEVELVRARSKPKPAITRHESVIEVGYPQLKVVVDLESGMLSGVVAYGEPILSRPMELRFYGVGEGVIQREGAMGPGYGTPAVRVRKGERLAPPRARLVRSSSTMALTELQFLIRPEKGPSVGLTYRIYPNHQIEITSTERPWAGLSPWLECGVEHTLALNGQKESLAPFNTHFPYYGFKEYPASVADVGARYRGTNISVVELGEQSVNGRIWHRRLGIYPNDAGIRRGDFLELMDEGLVVKVAPMSASVPSGELRVLGSDEAGISGSLLVQTLRQAGVPASVASNDVEKTQPALELRRLDGADGERVGIEGDGFSIRPRSGRPGVEIAAVTRFGLFRGVQTLAGDARPGVIPLVADNPVVELRGGGFGGGNFEVDFPYGSEAEWLRAFDNLIASGMNRMTCLGMWGNWKMPIHYKYMPELLSDDPEAYDELSGAKFSEFESFREPSLRRIRYLQDRGVKVWLWIPVGAIPTTFEEKYPEATTPKNRKIPRVLHPKYQELLRAYFKELLELYPVDGFMLVRDDNGGVDDTEEYAKFIASSRTKHPVWEQYLMVYDLVRSQGFKGEIAVYPYFDFYEPYLEPHLPPDLLVIGHGSGIGALTRQFEAVGPMGDTWLDNPYTGGFRLPTASKMKRLLADRSSYWIGGAYCGTELPWEAVGYFGWQPTASVNTFRHDFGERTFGEAGALSFVHLSNAYESLWEIMSVWLLPHRWIGLSGIEQDEVMRQGRRRLRSFREALEQFKGAAGQQARAEWLDHVELYDSFFDYNLNRATLFAEMQELVVTHEQHSTNGTPLPENLRQRLIALNEEIYRLARRFDDQAATVPGHMMQQTRVHKMTMPFKEWVGGFDPSLDAVLRVKQFSGRLQVAQPSLTCRHPFQLEIELQNGGCFPWVPGTGMRLELEGDTKELSLPEKWEFQGAPMVFGDRRLIRLSGMVPAQAGTSRIKVGFIAPFRNRVAFLSQSIELTWP